MIGKVKHNNINGRLQKQIEDEDTYETYTGPARCDAARLVSSVRAEPVDAGRAKEAIPCCRKDIL